MEDKQILELALVGIRKAEQEILEMIAARNGKPAKVETEPAPKKGAWTQEQREAQAKRMRAAWKKGVFAAKVAGKNGKKR